MALAALAAARAATPLASAALQGGLDERSFSGGIAFQRLVIPNDVPAHLASALAQDTRGILWIGTQGGLVRWDGLQFRVFASDPSDPATLGGNYVRSLLAARDGRLWVGTFGGGLSVFDPAHETFVRYRHDSKAPQGSHSLAHDRVEGLAEDRSGAIWIATSGGLDRLDPASNEIAHFHHDAADPASLADDYVRGLLVDREGRLWVGSRGGLQGLRTEGGFERVASDPAQPDSLATDLVERLFEDRRGRIWIGTAERGAAVLDPASGRLLRFPAGGAGERSVSHRWIYGFAETGPPAAAEIWIATFGGGVDVVDAATLTVAARLRHDPALADTIPGERVGSILADRSGLVWVGGWGQGVARHDPSSRAFRMLRASPNRPDGLTHTAIVRALPLPDGTVWAGTNGNGIDVLARDGRRVATFRPDSRDAGALADGAVTCLARAADGTVWVATLDGTLHRRRPGAGRFERLGTAQGLPGGAIRALTFGPDGALWAGAAQGMARIDPETLTVKSYRDWPETQSAPAIEAIAFLPSDPGALWVGSDNGLFRFDLASTSAKRFARDAAQPDGLPDNWVPDLLVARDGRLWVGTAGGACRLVSWSSGRLVCESITGKLGRAAEPAQSLIEDDFGQVWIGGRLRVDPATWTATAFGPADGVTFRTLFIASRARDATGRLYFGSPEGLAIVDPAALAPWEFAPPLAATGLQIDGRPVPGAPHLAALTLAPGERGFRLDFAAFDLSAPERLRYRSRLAGYDRTWIAGDATQRSAAYTGLPPGRYTLEVEATNRAGRWSEAKLRLPIEVLPAFHQTVWFRALLVALFVALAGLLHRLRIRQLRLRSERLEREVELRTAELATANSELTVAYRRIEEASLTDPLTGLRNRRYLEQVIVADLDAAVRAYHSEEHPRESDLLVLLLDLDHFKSVNDEHGHAAGDAVLVQMAELLRATFRSSDHLARWGGEEFLVVARQVDRDDGPELAEKLRAAVELHRFRLPDGTLLARTISIGFAPFPFCRSAPRAIAWESVVHVADVALYAAKRSGRNGWVGFEPQRKVPVASARAVAADPAAALPSDAVSVAASTGLDRPLRWT